MNEKEFNKEINKHCIRLNLDLERMAKICQVSVATMQRWVTGLSAPHVFGRETIINILGNFK